MVEPVSIACGVLFAGLGKGLWVGAAKVGDQALGGLIGVREGLETAHKDVPATSDGRGTSSPRAAG